ncbi:MAG: hypothetical protein A2231_00645 [Candidatus Firestonebacteria bacterium RIFOXYA2_FULL_40_8]|nr:MAG: hypothetical protein A2231_00645 [Candidatus Firestonebacteria bacterium RIFOXYA2_FULL_40_8]
MLGLQVLFLFMGVLLVIFNKQFGVAVANFQKSNTEKYTNNFMARYGGAMIGGCIILLSLMAIIVHFL